MDNSSDWIRQVCSQLGGGEDTGGRQEPGKATVPTQWPHLGTPLRASLRLRTVVSEPGGEAVAFPHTHPLHHPLLQAAQLHNRSVCPMVFPPLLSSARG